MMKINKLPLLALMASVLMVSCEKKMPSGSVEAQKSKEDKVVVTPVPPVKNEVPVEPVVVVDENRLSRILSHDDLEILMIADSYESKITGRSYSEKKGTFSISYRINLASTKKYSKMTAHFIADQDDDGHIELRWNPSKNSKVPDWYATAYDKVIRKMSRTEFEFMKDEFPIAYNNFYDVYYSKVGNDK